MTQRTVDAAKQAAADNNLTGGAVADPEALQAFLDDMAATINANAADAASKGSATVVWTPPTLQNAWVNYGAPYGAAGYYKDDLNMVNVRAFLKSGTATNNTLIWAFPAGYKPSAQIIRVALSYNGTSYFPCTVEIKADGSTVTGVNVANTWLAMDFSFRAEQ